MEAGKVTHPKTVRNGQSIEQRQQPLKIPVDTVGKIGRNLRQALFGLRSLQIREPLDQVAREQQCRNDQRQRHQEQQRAHRPGAAQPRIQVKHEAPD
jgi:hypothetical protein